jgi:RHS repeat-associated protein
VYDEAGHLLGEYDSSGALLQETIWLGDIPIATLRPGTPVGLFYVHVDHLNTPRRITQPVDNQLRWTWEADPFGAEVPNENPTSLGALAYNLRFPGQFYDGHTQLMYNHFREYDPSIGRYVESDPTGLEGGQNTYLYVRARPLSAVDPDGLVANPIDPKQNCLDGLGIGCFGQQNNPGVPGKPPKPGQPTKPDKDYCAKHSIEMHGCNACCTLGAFRQGPIWQGQCAAECAWQFVGCEAPGSGPNSPSSAPSGDDDDSPL